ncbi:TetR/AcrR family transcriptional regulator [Mycolicibacterium elephantis]
MPVTRTPPEVWIAEAFRALGVGGPEAVRVELLAQKIGVTKGGFYWHFEDREALLTAVLEEWERAGTWDIIERIEAESPSTDARARLQTMFRITTAPDGDELTRAELAIRVWGKRDEDVAERIRRVDRRRMDYLRSLFGQICESPEDVEARSLAASSIMMGSQLMETEHGKYSRAELIKIVLDQMLE